MKAKMKKTLTPLPDFNQSFTHSCNNLASYEQKKNPVPDPNPKRTITTKGADLSEVSGSSRPQFVEKKANFQTKKQYGTTLDELKTFARPNLDDGNRFYEDNRVLYGKFAA